MPKVPKWANKLIDRVCADRGVSRPAVIWRKFSRESSSGCCWTTLNKIQVNAGRSRRDARLVLLHELAHAIRGEIKATAASGIVHYHDEQFWRIAFTLYREYSVPMKYAVTREASYRDGSTAAYAKMRSEESIASRRPALPRPTPTREDLLAAKLSGLIARQKVWTRKYKLAATKLKKLAYAINRVERQRIHGLPGFVAVS
jgi:hypothetical protein